ncbi:MAG TPA: carboxypeptidase-like regulatory domain-containing protein, partial [Candidatus Tectomicrobia bacterium]
MRTTRPLSECLVAVGIAVILALWPDRPRAQQSPDAAIRIGATDLGGVVTGPDGPEAGVWVIAETTDLPTKFAKIVVTDDQGRYVMPDLPKATYHVWVRGYGLIDSPKVQAEPGKLLNLQAVVAPNATAAAEYYPAIYWYAMLKVPDKSEFPGSGPNGNGIAEAMKSQSQWLDIVKTDGCYTCHQLGNQATRTVPKELGDFPSSEEAWARRIQSGQAMTQ